MALNVASCGGVAIDAVDHEHHHRRAEQIVVEGAQELGDENRQEPPRAQAGGRVPASRSVRPPDSGIANARKRQLF